MGLEINREYFEERAKQENNSDLWFICNFGIVNKAVELYNNLLCLKDYVNITKYEISIDNPHKHFLDDSQENFIELYAIYELFEEWDLFDIKNDPCGFPLEELFDDYETITILNYSSMLGKLEEWFYDFIDGNTPIVTEY